MYFRTQECAVVYSCTECTVVNIHGNIHVNIQCTECKVINISSECVVYRCVQFFLQLSAQF